MSMINEIRLINALAKKVDPVYKARKTSSIKEIRLCISM